MFTILLYPKTRTVIAIEYFEINVEVLTPVYRLSFRGTVGLLNHNTWWIYHDPATMST
jgi:hypothetical protein